MSEHQEVWCQPADQPKRQFIVMFDDPQMDVAVFDDEVEARAYWEKANLNWTCYLMSTMPRSPSPQPNVEGPQPCGIADPSSRDCPNMKEVGGGMDGERYRCDVCGKGYYLDYEEMK